MRKKAVSHRDLEGYQLVHCESTDKVVARELYAACEDILRTLVGMIHHADPWMLPSPKGKRR